MINVVRQRRWSVRVRWRLWCGGVCVTGLLIAAAACDKAVPQLPVVEIRWPRAESVTEGTVTLLEIGSVGCTVCQEFAVHTLSILDAAYVSRGILSFEYVELPLSDTAFADSVTALHRCAGGMKTAAAVHSELIRKLQEQSPSSVLKNLDRETQDCFADDFRGETTSGRSSAVANLGVQATPSFVVGRHHRDGRMVGWLVTGLPRFRFLQDLIARADSAVAKSE
ncbi:MAG: thioredoxin domain-containing protein [Gemmatimonadales bacterium]|nr:thioredoxin domain-containing protein [Gemmatimonadales bacterium]MYG49539.1 thioredoxin domain-containing protein [Gemmatimonadales bacterium]MYK02404.1 thioredoxin domain-containing protein [Candidatus Palauibacter ramosifaciens]